MLSRRALLLCCAAFIIPTTPAIAQRGEPGGIVKSIYKRAASGNGDSGGQFLWETRKAREQHFSRSINALWAAADSRWKKGEIGPLDFDPVTNSQDPLVKSYAVGVEWQSADTAVVAATFAGLDPKHKEIVRYDFVREDGQWKIDDIRGSVEKEEWSLREILKQYPG